MARNRYYEDESSREGIDSQLLKRLLQFCKPYKQEIYNMLRDNALQRRRIFSRTFNK